MVLLGYYRSTFDMQGHLASHFGLASPREYNHLALARSPEQP